MIPISPKPNSVSVPSQPVDLAAIEHALAELWKSPDPADPKHALLTRACMSNLIVFCSNQDQASLVTEELDEIVRLHPSRVLLLIGDLQPTTSTIDANVTAICHLAGNHGHVCSEHVTITATGQAVQRLPYTARSLLLGDLPTSLWWASHEPPPLGGHLFKELEEMADQVIYSSLSWTDPARDVIATAHWAKETETTETFLADLAWRRLKPWRSLIAQSLDPSAIPSALDSIIEVTILHGAHGEPQSWLLLGWLASRLGWQSTQVTRRSNQEWQGTFLAKNRSIQFRLQMTPEGDPEVHSVSIAWKTDGLKPTMTVSSNTPGKLSMSYEGVDAQPRVLVAPFQSRATVVGLQLQNLERDDVFEAALDVARQLAEAVSAF